MRGPQRRGQRALHQEPGALRGSLELRLVQKWGDVCTGPWTSFEARVEEESMTVGTKINQLFFFFFPYEEQGLEKGDVSSLGF